MQLRKYQTTNEIVAELMKDMTGIHDLHGLIVSVPQIVFLVEKQWGRLSSSDKKTIAVSCVKYLVDKFIPPQDKQLCNEFIDIGLPPLIDATVALAHCKLFKKGGCL